MTRTRTDASDPALSTRLNSMVAPFGWVMTLCCAVPAIWFWRDTQWLLVVSLVFCVGYVSSYRYLSSTKDRIHSAGTRS